MGSTLSELLHRIDATPSLTSGILRFILSSQTVIASDSDNGVVGIKISNPMEIAKILCIMLLYKPYFMLVRIYKFLRYEYF